MAHFRADGHPGGTGVVLASTSSGTSFTSVLTVVAPVAGSLMVAIVGAAAGILNRQRAAAAARFARPAGAGRGRPRGGARQPVLVAGDPARRGPRATARSPAGQCQGDHAVARLSRPALGGEGPGSSGRTPVPRAARALQADAKPTPTAAREGTGAMSFNLAVILRETASASPGKPVALFPGGQLAYGELDALSDRLAAGLESSGLRPGDVVALQLPNIPQFLVAYFGILKAGCVV